MKKLNTKNLVGLAMLTAIVIVLQILGSFIKFGTFSVSLVLIPIVVGAALYGWISGAWLGFVFGIVVLLSGDAALFLGVNPLATIVIVILKGTLAGLCAGITYKACEKVNATFATFIAAIVCPIVNTGVFLIGTYFFFLEIIQGIADSLGFTGSVYTYLIVGFVGANFLFELLVNIVLNPVIIRIIHIGNNPEEIS